MLLCPLKKKKTSLSLYTACFSLSLLMKRRLWKTDRNRGRRGGAGGWGNMPTMEEKEGEQHACIYVKHLPTCLWHYLLYRKYIIGDGEGKEGRKGGQERKGLSAWAWLPRHVLSCMLCVYVYVIRRGCFLHGDLPPAGFSSLREEGIGRGSLKTHSSTVSCRLYMACMQLPLCVGEEELHSVSLPMKISVPGASMCSAACLPFSFSVCLWAL